MPFLLAEILNFQGSTHRIGVGSFSKESKCKNHRVEELLFYQDKRKVDADARLVHYLYFYKMV